MPPLTEHQQERRNSYIGATDIPAILGCDEWGRAAIDVWYEKLGMLDPWEGNMATRIGQVLEPAILDEAETKLGKLRRGGERVYHGLVIEGAKILRVHPDAVVVESGDPVEAKSAGILRGFAAADEWGDPGTDEVPTNYIVQCHGQMIATEREVCHLMALVATRGFVLYRIERNDELAEMIVNEVGDFWSKHIVPYLNDETQIPPEGRPRIDTIKRLRRQPDKWVDLDDDAEQLVAAWQELQASQREAGKQADEAKKRVIELLGDAEAARLTDGRELTYMETERAAYEVKATRFRTLRIRKAKKARKGAA